MGASNSGRSSRRSLWMSSVSRALQTETRRVLALLMIALPIARSPSLSKYACTTPAPVSITGIRALSRTKSISRLPPRGMHTSMNPTAPSISPVASWVAGSSVTTFSSMALSRSTLWMSFMAAWLELSASLPPFSTHALPLLKHSENTSKVTLGRAS